MKIILHEISMPHKNKDTDNKGSIVSSNVIFKLKSYNLAEGKYKVEKSPQNNLNRSIWVLSYEHSFEGTILII